MHIGVDIGGAVGTPVHAVHEGVVHSCGYNAAAGDYGHVIVITHEINGLHVWALHGHLSAASIVGRAAGQRVRGGERLGWLGDEGENGGWPPHVHYQLALEEPATHDMPGVVARSKHVEALRIYPDPRGVLGALYPGDGPFLSRESEMPERGGVAVGARV